MMRILGSKEPDMDADYEFIEAPDGQYMMLEDKVYSRSVAYIALLIEANKIRDPSLMEEAMEMLKRIRLSIPNASEVSLREVKGGRGN
jgi:hypothetical protein